MSQVIIPDRSNVITTHPINSSTANNRSHTDFNSGSATGVSIRIRGFNPVTGSVGCGVRWGCGDARPEISIFALDFSR